MEPFDLGIYIRDKRIEKKLTQKQLSTITGLAISTISGIENGSTKPSVDSMGSIALALSIDLNIMYGIKKATHRMVDCDGLTDKQIKIVNDIIEEFRKR